MKSKDKRNEDISQVKNNSLREQINSDPYIVLTKVRSNIVPEESLAEKEYKITCPSCTKKYWYGMGKRHHCSKCNIWIIGDYGYSGLYEKLYVSLTKKGLGLTDWEERVLKLEKEEKMDGKDETQKLVECIGGHNVYRVIGLENLSPKNLEKRLNELSEEGFYVNLDLTTKERIVMTRFEKTNG
ncbi:MAG: hypothetical protein KAS32_19485 [Candidatus Peribacteraceae bacterium]|nr:hypothetical protein [Candidatus Peribacteraceae bacterium]